MVTEDYLKVINSALALGDPAIPPSGTVLSVPSYRRGAMFARLRLEAWQGEPELWQMLTAGTAKDRTCLHLRSVYPSPDEGALGHRFLRLYMPADAPDLIPRIHSIPDAAPPFEEWRRHGD